MIIERKIKLKNNIYYIIVDVEYRTNKNNVTKLCIKNYENVYFDNGDFSNLIKKIEYNYGSNKTEKYDKQIDFMNDVIYIYDRVPFLSGIKDVYISENDNLPYSICYISKNEIDEYINEHKIIINNNSNFKLYDETTWNL